MDEKRVESDDMGVTRQAWVFWKIFESLFSKVISEVIYLWSNKIISSISYKN